MKKIMFNDRYGLTQAVIDGRKSMTRRKLTLTLHERQSGDTLKEVYPDKVFCEDGKWMFECAGKAYPLPKENYPRYNLGEEVAVAQNYNDAGIRPWQCVEAKVNLRFYSDYRLTQAMDTKGWRNKMYVKSDLMPHRILINGIHCERLQDISDADCLREGVLFRRIGYYVKGLIADCEKESYIECPDGKCYKLFPTPRKAFAALVDKVSGRGTWQRNPWVVVYEFKLVK